MELTPAQTTALLGFPLIRSKAATAHELGLHPMALKVLADKGLATRGYRHEGTRWGYDVRVFHISKAGWSLRFKLERAAKATQV